MNRTIQPQHLKDPQMFDRCVATTGNPVSSSTLFKYLCVDQVAQGIYMPSTASFAAVAGRRSSPAYSKDHREVRPSGFRYAIGSGNLLLEFLHTLQGFCVGH